MRRSQVRRRLQTPARYRGGQEFSLKQPLATHFRPARCEEVECEAHVEGWVTVLDAGNPEHGPLFLALKRSGRHYTEMRSEEVEGFPPGMTAFVFPPGQQCFEGHQVPVEREPFMLHRTGTGRLIRHVKATDFTEDFNEEGYRVNRLLGKA